MLDFLLHRKQDICCGQDRTVQINAQENQSFVFYKYCIRTDISQFGQDKPNVKNRKNWFGRV